MTTSYIGRAGIGAIEKLRRLDSHGDLYQNEIFVSDRLENPNTLFAGSGLLIA